MLAIGSLKNLRRDGRDIAVAVAVSISVLLAVLLISRQAFAPVTSKRSHPMTDMTIQTKTVCIGRYLLDVPAAANTSLGVAEADFNRIDRISNFADQAAYERKIVDRELELRSTKHTSEGWLLRSVIKPVTGQPVVFVSRPNANDEIMYLVESFVKSSVNSWRVHYETGEKYLQETVEQIAAISQALRSRDADSIPAGPGGCLQDGVLVYRPKEQETYYGGAEIPSRSWSLSITTETSGPRDNVQFKDLFHRVDDAIAMAGVGSGIRKLRRAIVETDGGKGQEYIGLYPEKNGVIFDAKLELYGNGTPQVPTIKLLMETGWPKKKHPDDPRTFLNEEESLAIWDAIVKSIRPRPGAF